MSAAKTLIVIVGPTASGKTSLAVDVARYLQTEIVSADSRQIYDELHIGVAKPTQEELFAVPHHLIGHVSIHRPYNAGSYATDAMQVIQTLFETHHYVVLVGGSGLYINAVLEGMDPLPSDQAVRSSIRALYESEGIAALHEELAQRDPVYYSKVDLSNPHRLMRAIEVSRISGAPYSDLLTGQKRALPFDVLKVGLTAQREFLYQRINERVDAMVQAGLIEEVRDLYPHRHYDALQTVGYKEIFDCIERGEALEGAIEKIKQHTRQYAKRQLTWWRRDEQVNWAAIDQGGQLLSFVKGLI
jgi:tRNA dimethylallyltransferase